MKFEEGTLLSPRVNGSKSKGGNRQGGKREGYDSKSEEQEAACTRGYISSLGGFGNKEEEVSEHTKRPIKPTTQGGGSNPWQTQAEMFQGKVNHTETIIKAFDLNTQLD